MKEEELWKVIKRPVTDFVKATKQMESHINRLVDFYLQNAIATQSPAMHTASQSALSPLAVAKIELAIVFALNACYWMCLVTHGQDPQENDIKKELQRLKLFMNRAKEVEESLLFPNSKRPKIDVDASNRLCINSLSLASKWETED